MEAAPAIAGDHIALDIVPILNFHAGTTEVFTLTGHFSDLQAPPAPTTTPRLCIRRYPDELTFSGFLNQISDFIGGITLILAVSIANSDERVLIITFRSRELRDSFYDRFHERRITAVQGKVYELSFVDLFFYIRLAPAPATCTLCNGNLSQPSNGELITWCDHIFHVSCMSRWEEIHCPICGYELLTVPRPASFWLRVARYATSPEFLPNLHAIIGDVSRLINILVNLRRLTIEGSQRLAAVLYKIAELFRSFRSN